jgi:glucokinase
MKDTISIGIDIGGSHITAALVDLKSRRVIPGSGLRRAVNSNLDADQIFDSWCAVINQVKSTAFKFDGNVGISMPGPFDYDAGISLIKDQEKFRSLYLLNLKEELASRLDFDSAQFRFINDAAGFLQGEVFGGAAKGHEQVIGLTLGTGLGSAIYCDERAQDAALWNSVFKEGIAEDYLSTRWFVSRCLELSGMKINGVKELVELKDNSPLKSQIFEEFGHNLGEFLTPLIKEHQPTVIVLGGNIANTFELFSPSLAKKLAENAVHAEIKIAELKEDASLIGAASCWNT